MENTDSSPEHRHPAPRNPVARLLSHLNLTQLFLTVLAAIFLWQWLDGRHQLSQMQQTLAERLTDMDGNSKASQALTLQAQEQLRVLGSKLGLLEGKFAETQGQRAALENLYDSLSSSRDQMILSEVEQLLLIAGQQLQLAGNVRLALIAMQQAEQRLQRHNRAAWNPLQRAIANDIEKLRALPEVDVSAINTKLDNLVSMIDRMPLLQDLRPASPPTDSPAPASNAISGFLQELWQELRALVRIENTQENELPLLAPSQQFFLRENLKLRLLSARLALLTRDEAGFRRDLKTAQESLKLYFNPQSAQVTQAISTLQKLNASTIRIELPDISTSLDSVRHYRASREKGAR